MYMFTYCIYQGMATRRCEERRAIGQRWFHSCHVLELTRPTRATSKCGVPTTIWYDFSFFRISVAVFFLLCLLAPLSLLFIPLVFTYNLGQQLNKRK